MDGPWLNVWITFLFWPQIVLTAVSWVNDRLKAPSRKLALPTKWNEWIWLSGLDQVSDLLQVGFYVNCRWVWGRSKMLYITLAYAIRTLAGGEFYPQSLYSTRFTVYTFELGGCSPPINNLQGLFIPLVKPLPIPPHTNKIQKQNGELNPSI